MLWNRVKAWMHKWHVAGWLRAIRRWMADWSAMDEHRVLLSPKILSPDKGKIIEQSRYIAVQELRNAIDSERCNNIAITGVYGSGKSSVIQTFLTELRPSIRKKRVLSISLSNFIDTEIHKPLESPEKYENEIEQKIFQHILFKTNQNKTRQTRYSRISHISITRGLSIAFMVLISIACIFVLFVPTASWPTHIASWYKDLSNSIHLTVEIMAIVGICATFLLFTTYLIRRFHHLRVTGKINADKVQLEWHAESSKFDKLLDEILYFFKAGGYRIVIFEDLDRIKHPERLFLKLREINVLLNESDYYKRRNRSIKFIYAIRDDVFSGDIRTKCFDYIIPIVPIIDKYNAIDYMISEYHQGLFAGIEERDLMVLGMNIGSKRELNNIVNEYAIYHKTFTNLGEDAKKFLAMLVYKNAYPDDYAAACLKEGCLAKVFSEETKEVFYKPLLVDLEETLQSYKKGIEIHRSRIQQYRHKVLSELTQQGITDLIVDGKEFDLESFETNDQLYEIFVQNKIDKCIVFNGDGNVEREYHSKFDDLLKRAYPDTDRGEYENSISQEQDMLRMSIASRDGVQRQIDEIKNQKLSGLIKKRGFEESQKIISEICHSIYEVRYPQKDDKYKKICEQHSEMLFIFVKEEFIEADYATYLSHTYPGSLTEKDALFVNTILKGQSLEYNHPLKHLETITKRLNSENYKNANVLNYNLVDHLIESKDSVNLGLVVGTARKNPDFVVKYATREKYGQKFVKQVFTSWPEALWYIASINDVDIRDGMYKLYMKEAPCDERLTEGEKTIFSTMYDYICQNISIFDVSKLKQYIGHHNILFSEIKAPKEEAIALYKYIINEKHFAITYDNLKVIYGEKFDDAAFTQVYTQQEAIRSYIIENTNVVLDFIPETSVNEDASVILTLLNTTTSQADPSKLNPYICRQHNQIDSKGVLNDALLPPLLDVNIIRPTWENVGNCIGRMSSMNPIVEFVKRNIDAVCQEPCKCDNAMDVELLLLTMADMTDEDYQKMVRCFEEPLTYAQIKDLPEERLRILNAQDLLIFDDDMIVHISSFSDKLFAEFLEVNFDLYIEREEEMPVEIGNAVGVEMLNSGLTLQQKQQYMEKNPFNPKDTDAELYAPLYCAYNEKIGVSGDVDDIEALIAAMEAYPAPRGDGESWRVHISLVNQINRKLGKYDRELETKMINTIGEYYKNLNLLGNSPKSFERNTYNEELLYYLQGKHYVNKVTVIDDSEYRVTFKRKDNKKGWRN